jgi:hypothetical protein
VLRSLSLGIALLVAALFAGSVQAAETAGEVTEANGEVFAQHGTESRRALSQGAAVYSGDRITTAADSSVEMRFSDNARFALGSSSEMNVGQYVYKPNDDASIMQTDIVKGVFRFVSGLIARHKPQAVKLNTPVATIGIRGTHVIGEVTATSASIALMEPEEAGKATAIEVSNQYGSVVIDKPRYETVIPDAHSPPSPPRLIQTQRIDTLLRQIQTSRRVIVPRTAPRLP